MKVLKFCTIKVVLDLIFLANILTGTRRAQGSSKSGEWGARNSTLPTKIDFLCSFFVSVVSDFFCRRFIRQKVGEDPR